jgi:hypothetical protein
MPGFPLKVIYDRAPVDIDELEMRDAFAASDLQPLDARARLQISRSLDRCVRLRQTLRTRRLDHRQVRLVLRAEQRILVTLRVWCASL